MATAILLSSTDRQDSRQNPGYIAIAFLQWPRSPCRLRCKGWQGPFLHFFSPSHGAGSPECGSWAAKASFASIRSNASIPIPVSSNTFLVAATGPTPIISGATPARVPARQYAMGFTPSSSAFSSLITTTAAAPSLMLEAFLLNFAPRRSSSRPSSRLWHRNFLL